MPETRKDIRLAYGIHRTPSVANEGELSECVNLIPVGGELINLQPPLSLDVNLPDGYELIYVHVNSGFRHYIIRSGSTVSWIQKGMDTPQSVTELSGNLKSVNAIGNTLCIFTDTQAQYAIFRSGKYVAMESQPPVPDMSFRLRAQITKDSSSSRPTVTFTPFTASSSIFSNGIHLTTEAAQAVRESLFAYFNPIIAEQRKAGRFHHSFFVRYAYRMYDGSSFVLSSPVKMVLGYPSNLMAYISLSKDSDGAYYQALFGTRSVLSGTLSYQLNNSDAVKKGLEQWKDLITHIDVYVTPPLSFVDEDKSCVSVLNYNEVSMSPDYNLTNEVGAVASFGEKDDTGKKEIFRKFTTRDVNDCRMMVSSIPTATGDGLITFYPSVQYSDDGEKTLPFYRIYSVEVDKLSSAEENIVPDNGLLDALSEQTRLEADGQPSETLLPESAYVYNGRLHLAHVHAVPRSYPLESLFPFTNGYRSSSSTIYKVPVKYERAYVIIEGDRTNVAVPLTVPDSPDFRIDKGTFVFYPNPKAKYLVFTSLDASGNAEYYVTALWEHKALDGAYGYVASPSDEESSLITELIDNSDGSFLYPNKLYVSEANNPFTFNLSGIVSVGTGEIKGMAAATTALSQGQYGQFPLYVFASDGVWSLSVGSTGLYSSVHPISRDVCNNPDSITQIDSAVVFTTERGMKLLQGSEVTLLSEAMDGHNVNESSFNIEPEYASLLIADTDRFTEMLRTCRMAYDYAHSLIHIYLANDKGKHYVYSLQSGEFSSYVGYTPEKVVSDFPETVVQIGTQLYSLQNFTSADIRKGILITRPLVFDDDLTFKMLCQLRLHKYRTDERSKYRIAAFGSNDGFRYYRIDSLKKVSVKYYRFVIYTEMSDIEALYGMSVIVDSRYTGKLR